MSDREKLLEARLEYIWAIGCDYDGYNNVADLKDLIDELVGIAQGEYDDCAFITELIK